MKYLIMGKLGGSFGGTELFEVVEAKDYNDASLQSWFLAKESYQNYEGNYGLLTLDECESEEEYNDEVESWIEYEVIKEVDDNFDLDEFENNYKITGDYE